MRTISDRWRQNSLDCFFFSSRRRHTRLQGDWSSDVCSSDLNSATAWSHFSSSAERRAKLLSSFTRSEEHTSELQSPCNLVCRLLLEKKKIRIPKYSPFNQNTLYSFPSGQSLPIIATPYDYHL